MRVRKRGHRGFSLVEVAVALLIVAVGFTAILSIFPVGMQWTRDSLFRNAGMQGAASVANTVAATRVASDVKTNGFWYQPRIESAYKWEASAKAWAKTGAGNAEILVIRVKCSPESPRDGSGDDELLGEYRGVFRMSEP